MEEQWIRKACVIEEKANIKQEQEDLIGKKRERDIWNNTEEHAKEKEEWLKNRKEKYKSKRKREGYDDIRDSVFFKIAYRPLITLLTVSFISVAMTKQNRKHLTAQGVRVTFRG
jgi:hypothetical protein